MAVKVSKKLTYKTKSLMLRLHVSFCSVISIFSLLVFLVNSYEGYLPQLMKTDKCKVIILFSTKAYYALIKKGCCSCMSNCRRP